MLDQLDQGAVLDREPLYKDLRALDAHPCIGIRGRPGVVGYRLEGCLKASHCFHVELRKVSLTPDGTWKMP
jgi:hypothetical protein